MGLSIQLYEKEGELVKKNGQKSGNPLYSYWLLEVINHAFVPT
jgi:hypothetical protein